MLYYSLGSVAQQRRKYYQQRVLACVMSRWMALDVGSKTIGIALTDPLNITVRPLTTLSRKTVQKDIEHIVSMVQDHEVEKMIVGMPRYLDGTRSDILNVIEPLVITLRDTLEIPVEWADESLSTKHAEKIMAQVGVSISQRRNKRNEFSAAVILQWYLEESKPT